jgi:hypothetical protein
MLKLFRSLGLESLYILVRKFLGHSPIEKQKVVIRHDLGSAVYLSLLHIIPVSVSITFIYLAWNGYYIGKELSGKTSQDGLKLLGLQFAAKILELLAMSSLSIIMFALLREYLILDALPFGALGIGFNFSKIQVLWSKEFVATCTANFSSPKKRFLLITAIVVFAIIGATVGPATATAAQPVLQNWPAGGTEFWLNTTSYGLYLTQLEAVSPEDIPCTTSQTSGCFPYSPAQLGDGMLGSWPVANPPSDGGFLAKEMPEKVILSGRSASIQMATRFRGPLLYQPDITAVTAPLTSIADALSHLQRYWFMANTSRCARGLVGFCFYNDIVYSVDSAQPVSYVKCIANDLTSVLVFPKISQGPDRYTGVEYNDTDIRSESWFNITTGNGSYPGIDWVKLPESEFGHTSMGAIIALPVERDGVISAQVLGCSIDARWANVTLTTSFINGPRVITGLPNDWFIGAQYKVGRNGSLVWPRVNTSLAWAEEINTQTAGLSMSQFRYLCNSVGRLGNISKIGNPVEAVEAILAMMFTSGLSRTNSMVAIRGSLKGRDIPGSEDMMNEMLPKKAVYGAGGKALNYSYTTGDLSTRFVMRTTVNGYGYGKTTSTILSTIVLFVYSFIALSYVAFNILFSRRTSSSWETISELVALALNSQPSSAMNSTGAGIDTIATHKKNVKVGVNQGRLGIVFDDEDDLKLVEPNQPYD